MLFMLTCNGFIVFRGVLNKYFMCLLVLISNMVNIDGYNSHKQKVFGVLWFGRV